MANSSSHQEREESRHRISPDMRELLQHMNPTPAKGAYTSLMRCNGEAKVLLK